MENRPVPCKHRHNANVDLFTAEKRKREGTKEGQTLGINQDFLVQNRETSSHTNIYYYKGIYLLITETPSSTAGFKHNWNWGHKGCHQVQFLSISAFPVPW